MSNNRLDELVQILESQTGSGKIAWTMVPVPESVLYSLGTPGHPMSSISCFRAELPNGIVSLRILEGEKEIHSSILSLETLKGAPIGYWVLANGATGWNAVIRLYEIVKRRVEANTLENVIESLKGDKVANETQGTGTTAFLNLVKGSWTLLYERGTRWYREDLRIDETGLYFIKGADAPTFQLSDILFDQFSNNVVFSKVDLVGDKKGRLRQTEVLKFDPNGHWMTGYAQHDGHQLKYTRALSGDSKLWSRSQNQTRLHEELRQLLPAVPQTPEAILDESRRIAARRVAEYLGVPEELLYRSNDFHVEAIFGEGASVSVQFGESPVTIMPIKSLENVPRPPVR